LLAQTDSTAADSTLEYSEGDTLEIVTHPQDVTEEAGYTIKRRFGELRIYGSLRVSGAYDLNGLTTVNNFSTYDIPVGEDEITQPRFFMVPYQTRIGLEIARSSAVGKIKAKVETDFLGVNNGLRIRHAFVESGNFLVGQTWSTFTDVNSIPITVDADGPNSSVRLRTVRLRYSDYILGKRLRYVVSLEAPDPDIYLPDSLSNRIPSQFLPDIAGLLRHDYSEGYIVVSGIIRGITVKDTSASADQVVGFGFLLAGTYDLDNENKFLFQGVYGQAIARFITALNGKGLDLIYNPVSQLFESTSESGILVSYSHKWRNDVSSTFTAGNVTVYNKDFESPDAFNYSFYLSGNIFWNPLLGIRLGVEFSHGRRVNNDGQSGRASRIGFIFYSDF
jgi:hypothetical protein